MDESDPKKEAAPQIMILERRTNRQSELNSSDIMKILRKRAAKTVRRGPNGGSGDRNGAG
jgi:hypothetical protein